MNEKDIRISTLEKEIFRLNEGIANAQLLQAEKNRLEEEHRNSERRFRTIFEQSTYGKKILTADLRIIQVNEALVQMLGYTKEELTGNRIINFAHPDFVEHWKELQHELWNRERTSFSIDTCLIKKDNTDLWCHVTSIIFEDHKQRLGYTILEDISARKELERTIEEANRQRLLLQQLEAEQKQQRLLLKSTINVQETERRRIGESLHNGLGQMLFGVKLKLDQVDFSSTERQAESTEALERSKEMLRECIRESRRISHQLIPAILEDFGLREAIMDICRNLSDAVQFRGVITGLPETMSKELEIVIYRSIQELMLNVVKHAGATQGVVKVSARKQGVIFSVEDNGKGLEPGRQTEQGIGLVTLRSSIYSFGGKMHISSTPLKGTVITIEIPAK
jgi:PAS domain S-box-containing protein